MKKKFVKVSLFCALVATASTGFVACADYDDDIKNLQEQVDANKTLAETLDAQIQDLKTALETANADIQAAKEAAAAAQEAADKANELAKQAAAEAKAEAIEEATKLVEALKADIEAKNYATTEELNAAISDVNSKIASVESGLNDKINSLNTTVDGIKADVDAAKQLISELQTQMAAVEAYKTLIDQNKVAIEGLDAKVDSLETELKAAIADAEQNAKDYTDTEIQKLKTELEGKINAVNSYLVTLLGQTLRSLVFVPNLYVDGIEAAEYDYLAYKPFETIASTAGGKVDGDQNGDDFVIEGVYGGKYSYDYQEDADANELYINPVVSVQYKMNPSSATIDDNALAFIEREVEVVSRGASSGKISFEKVLDNTNGILTVGLSADGVKISSQSGNDLEVQYPQVGNGENDATIFALQSTKKGDGTAENPDQTVTSDYAMLYASRLNLRALAFNDGTQTNTAGYNCDAQPATTELYKTPKEAAENLASFPLKYKDETLNLKSYIELHYDWASNTHNNGKCKKLSLEDAAKRYGLTVKFNRVKYTVGDNKTEDSQYITLTEDGVAKACAVDASGNPVASDNPVSAIGRHPLIQVLMFDANNKIVLDGYIKLEIVREVINKETECFDLGNVAFGCTNVTKTLTWSQISAQLLQNAAVTSREEFDALYTIDMNGADVALYKRTKDGDAPEYERLDATELAKYGVVTAKAEGSGSGTTTDVLTWTLTAPDHLQWIWESTADNGERAAGNDSQHAKTIYVKFKNKVTTNQSDKYPGIYLPLTIGVEKPQATVSGQIPTSWYNDLTQIRVNAYEPTQNQKLGADGIVKSLNSVWNGNAPTFDGIDLTKFASYANIATHAGQTGGYKYYFTVANNKEVLGASGTKYTLKVAQKQATDAVDTKNYDITTDNEYNNALLVNTLEYTNVKITATSGATTQDVATLNQNTGVVTYAYTDFAKDILNAYEHTSQESITFNVGITAYSTCGIALSLKDNTFDALVQRPVDIEGAEDVVFVDATDDGASFDIAKAFVFNDWRDQCKFVEGDDISHAWYFGYYDFVSATMVKDEITTTLGLSDDQAADRNNLENGEYLADVNKELKIDQYINGVKVTTEVPFNIVTPVASNNSGIYDKVVKGFGKIVYNNDNNNTKTFWLRIPVDFKYSWGTIRASVDVKVENTMGN